MDRARELRAELANPEQLCRELGITGSSVQRQRGGVLIECPFHAEKTASCSVSLGPDRTIRVRCFACGASGDALTLIAHVRGLDLRREFRAVLDAAADLAGRSDMRVPSSLEADEPPLDDPAYAALAAALADLCRLERQPEAMKYVARRGLLPGAAEAGLFALPRPYEQGRIISELLQPHGADALERAGWLWRDKGTGILGVDRFSRAGHRLCIPWRAPDGTIQSVQRRRLDAGEPKYIFPRGRRSRFPFGVERLASTSSETPIAFCEGALDTVALRLLARRGGDDLLVLGLPGVDCWRPGWAKLATRREAFVALDADAAGERKREQIVDDLFAAGAASVTALKPTAGAKDWAELLERSAQ
jgi:DNA primase